MSPEQPQQPQGTSPFALVALVTGTLGLAFAAMGCFLWPFMLVGSALSLVAIVRVLARRLPLSRYVEYKNIQRGTSPQSNRVYAVTGMGTGAGGCALGCLYALIVGLLLGAYVAFILFYVVFVAILVGTGQM